MTKILDIYLIRHTKVKVDSGICYGQTDVALADNFVESLKVIQNKMPTLPKDTVIISSPLQRCLQLAEKLNNNNTNNKIKTDERIMELNFGDWEMQSFNELEPNLFQAWMNDYINIAPPNGESLQTLLERCQNFWNELTQKTYQTAIIVTHLGVIRVLLAHILEMPIKKSIYLTNDYGAINLMKYYTDEKTNQTWTTIEYLNR